MWNMYISQQAIGIFGVGFCVARSTSMGNARALSSGTGNNNRLPRFFFMSMTNIYKTPAWESLALSVTNMEKNSDFIYHYTSAKTLLNLLDTKQFDEQQGDQSNKQKDYELTFLATEISALNDRVEYAEVKKMNDEIKEIVIVNQVTEAINGIPFILSFSKKCDYLPMWRSYSDNGRGVCLKFNSKDLKRHLCPPKQVPYKYIDAKRCYYKKPQKINDLHEIISSQCSNGIYSENAIKLLEYYVDFQIESAFLKDSCFKIEDEWRIVIFSKDYQFIESKYGIVARKLVKIPLSFLKEIYLGPCSSEILNTSIDNWIKLINDKTGNEIKVTKSELTYRD